MSSDDEWKLYALRQHIFKIAQLQLKYIPSTSLSPSSYLLSSASLNSLSIWY